MSEPRRNPGQGDEEPVERPVDADPAGLVGRPRAPRAGGGLGAILGEIVDAIAPAIGGSGPPDRRRTAGAASRRRRPPGSTGTAPLVAIRYHDGTSGTWKTARVAYAHHENRLVAVSGRATSWWRHVRSGSKVQVRIRDAWVAGFARVLSHDESTYRRAVQLFRDQRGAGATERAGLDGDAPRSGAAAIVVWVELEAS